MRKAREWLVQARMAKGLSQAEVAEQSGIVQQSYQLIENGANRPRPETAQRIGAVLGVPWVRFYEEEAREKSVNVDAFAGKNDSDRETD